MRIYRIQDLEKKKYGLSKEDKNPNAIEDSLDSAIMNNADAILKKRKGISDKVKQSKELIDKEAKDLTEKVNFISNNIGDFVDEKKTYEIQKVCERIVNGVEEYKDNVDILHERISNGKIRIAAIGWSRHGKSTFHRLYTGLGEEVFPSNDGNTQDTTGTVVVLHYEDRKDYLYKRTYFSEEEILSRINWYMREIEKVDKNWEIDGHKGEWRSYNEIVNCRVNEVKKINDSNDSKYEILLNGIKGYFTTIGWKKYIGKKDDDGTNDPSEAKQFIDIQAKDKLYLATKRIDVYAKFGTGILENFEIVDTKGMSLDVEARVNEDIKEEINLSDSVFSLVRTDQRTERKEFFDKALKNFRNDADFKNKHFVIVNEVRIEDKNGEHTVIKKDTDTTLSYMEESNLTNVVYVGNLKEKENDNNTKFARLVIKDMLFTIVNYVKEFDEARIRRCNQIKQGLTNDFNVLIEELSKIPADTTDIDSIIKKHIRDIVLECDKIIGETSEDRDEGKKDSKRYTEIVKEGKARMSIYELITRNNENDKVLKEWEKIDKAKSNNSDDSAKNEKEVEDRKIRKEIEIAIEDVYEKLPRCFTGNNSNKKYMSWHIGEYIEDVATGLNGLMLLGLTNLSNQDTIDDEKKNELGKRLWDCFKMNEIFPKDNWESAQNISKVRKIEFLKILSKFFTEKTKAQPGNSQNPCASHEVLYRYYTETGLKWEDNSVADISESNCDRIQDDRLKAIFTNMIMDNKIHDNIRKIYENRLEVPKDITTQIKDILGIGDNGIIEQSFSFYKENRHVILSDDDKEAIEKRGQWEIISKYKEEISETPLSDVKSI